MLTVLTFWTVPPVLLFDGAPDVQALSWGPNQERAATYRAPRGGANVSPQEIASMVIDTRHDRTCWLVMAALRDFRLELA